MKHADARCVLIVLDGWGHREDPADNAIAAARTPNWDALWGQCPHSLLDASGAAVGLPDGQMGNSEVGHSTLGAGRVLWQSLARLDRVVAEDALADNGEIAALMRGVAERGGRLHLFGLLSDGGVHSHENHLQALVRTAHHFGVQDLAMHAILDGRDTPPRSAEGYIDRMEGALGDCGYGPIADISGRYWAMDRDRNWERTERAWRLYADGQPARRAASARQALQEAYARDESDEFVEPTAVRQAAVEDGDALLFANFRADRMRQLVGAFVAGEAVGFERGPVPNALDVLTLTEYHPDLPVRVAFPAEAVQQSMGEVLAAQGLGQLRLAETEKFAHVTYFFSCGREGPFPGEKRILIPSPGVATYDLKPEMSAPEITATLEREMAEGDWAFALCNFANGDMVGHTGRLDAAVAAVECLDDCLGKLRRAAERHRIHLWITADHGNCEQMRDPREQQQHTAHTSNPVPLVCHSPTPLRLAPHGGLADIAPTLLTQMGLPPPTAMTGHSLLR